MGHPPKEQRFSMLPHQFRTHEERLSIFDCGSESEYDTDEGHIPKRRADKSFVSEKALDSLDEDFG
jgi:hypothetical protein